jgi:hypothetical protein
MKRASTHTKSDHIPIFIHWIFHGIPEDIPIFIGEHWNVVIIPTCKCAGVGSSKQTFQREGFRQFCQDLRLANVLGTRGNKRSILAVTSRSNYIVCWKSRSGREGETYLSMGSTKDVWLVVLRSRVLFVGSSLSKFVELRNSGLVFHPMRRNISGKEKNY